MMRTALLALLTLALAAVAPRAAAPAAEPVATAIVFAVDVSGSVNTERYELQRAGIAAIFADAEIGELLHDGLAVALMEWSDGPTVVVPWTILRMPADAHALARRVMAVARVPGYSTALSMALLAAADLLDQCPCQAVSRIIDVSGDGPNNGPISTPLARDEVAGRGVRIDRKSVV